MNTGTPGRDVRVSLFDVMLGLAGAVDLVDPTMADHHARVACIAHSIAREMGLSVAEQRDLICAGLLHDTGAFSLDQRLEFLRFDIADDGGHSEMGYQLVKGFPPFQKVGPLIRHHHAHWNTTGGQADGETEIPHGCHILHLADRVTVSIRSHSEVLGQADQIVERIRRRSGQTFSPIVVEAFCDVAAKEFFWLEATYPDMNVVLRERCGPVTIDLGMADLMSLAQLFCRIIDFRSRFTATHSNGVAEVASRLASLAGFSESDSSMMKIAGYLHDLGKLAVPLGILEKPDGLTPNEWHVMKKHPYYTYRVVRTVEELHVINSWAACHHEQLDGQGYPFHCTADQISIGARIMALADRFTALTEDRPYRQAMSVEMALSILHEMRRASKLDGDLVDLLDRNMDEIDHARATAQAAAVEGYSRLRLSAR